MHAMTIKPPLRSFRSFVWNVRTLGIYWWLRCAIENIWRAITQRFRDP